MDSLIEQFGDTDAAMVLVSHGGVYLMALPLVLTNVDLEFISERGGFDYTTLIVSELCPEGLVCLEWNGVAVSTKKQG